MSESVEWGPERDILTPMEHYRVADGQLQQAAQVRRADPALYRLLVAEAAVHAALAQCPFTELALRQPPGPLGEQLQPKE